MYTLLHCALRHKETCGILLGSLRSATESGSGSGGGGGL